MGRKSRIRKSYASRRMLSSVKIIIYVIKKSFNSQLLFNQFLSAAIATLQSAIRECTKSWQLTSSFKLYLIYIVFVEIAQTVSFNCLEITLKKYTHHQVTGNSAESDINWSVL